MFKRVLVANRGEIAVRIIRACREMGIHTVAVYSTADRDCLHTHLADESVCIGPPDPAESYLKVSSIIAAAEVADVQAIHPGYGFLSENARFAGICRDCKLVFIGPSPEALALSGDKAACRMAVRRAGVTVAPGSEGVVSDPRQVAETARSLGYPVLVKAALGGGGRGMRVAHNESSLKHAVAMAASEAEAAFGGGGVYIEKFIEDARHIEVQILADHHGKTAALGERECTIQRRHQKLIEETPGTALTPALRSRMVKAALRAARAIGAVNAGTAEFLLAPDGEFYFIEFNPRIQVEHTVTEEVTGIDLVREQIRVAAGEPLGHTQAETSGAAIQARVCAEDPEQGFRPNPGIIGRCHLPGGPGIRVDTHIFPGYEVPRHYDSLLAKIIARGRTRAEAAARLAGALDEFYTEGVRNNAAFCARILRGAPFLRGDITPGLLDVYMGRPEERAQGAGP
ncbi:MAG: acetyl-CoA carboxylase biotin carboxylase subunit [Candidatus Hydrogenedens sp.]|nr:acetyl-CoA carboxylase biotin carboxylase subunit [Candidatus Hydrogenedentota bacterium]NLF56166.1 acetyl-CoA carboxylase biotin carboxylase subunit [Candidatus Hydrogenedens sp.]